MKFIIHRETFLKSLNTTSKAIASKAIIPALANFKITVTKQGIDITTSNGDTSIIDKIATNKEDGTTILSVEREGSCLAFGRLVEIVRKLSGTDVSVELIDSSILKVDDGKSSYKLATMDAEEFPNFDFALDEECSFKMSTQEFAKCANQVAFAASTKDSKPILTAVNFCTANGELTITATDTARLSRKIVKIGTNKLLKANIPAKTFQDVAKMAEEFKEITIGILEKKAYFVFGNTILFTTLISGDYPNVSSIISRSFSIVLEANAQEMIDAMERVSVLFLERNVSAKLKITRGEVKISSKSPTLGSVEESISRFSFDSEDFELIYNCDYVLGAIRALGQSDVIFEFGGSLKPFIIRSENEPSLVQVITPLRMFN
ncbi:MAG: DNA polymerase III subunit beta [Bacilli bacterium]